MSNTVICNCKYCGKGIKEENSCKCPDCYRKYCEECVNNGNINFCICYEIAEFEEEENYAMGFFNNKTGNYEDIWENR